jgi:hypothetical protein
MKRHFSILAAFVAVLLMVTACINKPPVTLPNVPPIETTQIFQKNGVLVFPTSELLEQTVLQLEANLEAYDDAFLAKTIHLNEDKLEALEEKLGYDELAPLQAFEKKFQGHGSLRSKLTKLEGEWLAKTRNPDFSENPGAHDIESEVIRSLLNEQGEIMVDGKLFKVFPNGVTYAVLDGDFSTLARITAGYDEQEFVESNVVINDAAKLKKAKCGRIIGSCAFFCHSDTTVYLSSDRRVEMKVGVSNYLFYAQFVSKSTHYKKVRRKWKKRRAPMLCRLTNQAGISCDPNAGSQTNPEWSPSLKLAHKSYKKKRSRAIRNIIFGIRINIPSDIPVTPVDWAARTAENGHLSGNNTVEGVTTPLTLRW